MLKVYVEVISILLKKAFSVKKGTIFNQIQSYVKNKRLSFGALS